MDQHTESLEYSGYPVQFVFAVVFDVFAFHVAYVGNKQLEDLLPVTAAVDAILLELGRPRPIPPAGLRTRNSRLVTHPQ